jgi:hypothetical protein
MGWREINTGCHLVPQRAAPREQRPSMGDTGRGLPEQPAAARRAVRPPYRRYTELAPNRFKDFWR